MKEDNPFQETGMWNVGINYSVDIIMKHIYWIDQHEKIARIGAIDFNQDIELDKQEKDIARITALIHFYTDLDLLIGATKFAVKGKSEIDKFTKLHTKLKTLQQFLDGLKVKRFNQKENTITISVNEELFEKILVMLQDIKEKIYPVLHRSNILMMFREGFDPTKAKQSMFKRMTEIG